MVGEWTTRQLIRRRTIYKKGFRFNRNPFYIWCASAKFEAALKQMASLFTEIFRDVSLYLIGFPESYRAIYLITFRIDENHVGDAFHFVLV